MNQPSSRRRTNRGVHPLLWNRRGKVLDDASIGRIEEWVVSMLDDTGRALSRADWMESMGSLSLARRSEPDRPGPSSPKGAWARFRLARRKGMAVVSLTDQALIREDDLEELAGDLLALVEAGHLRIVLDFTAVERLSSWASRTIGEAVLPCLSTEGGSVKFSGLRSDLADLFAMTGLDPRVEVCPDAASAVGGSWPEWPALRPLPVSILTALMRAEEARPRPSRTDSERSRPGFEDHPTMFGARLIVQDGPHLGRSVSITQDRFLIGRGPSCQLRLGSSRVSRSHARIERRGRRFFLSDLSSTNGTFRNGRVVREEVAIEDGDVLRFGPWTFALAVGESRDRGDEAVRFDDRRDWPGPEEFAGSTEELTELGSIEGLKHEVLEGVLVVSPQSSALDGEAEVDAFRDGLISLQSRRLPDRVVVNLSLVGHLSGRAIGVLVAHHLRLDRTGGALRVCVANPRVALVLEQVKLGMLVEYHPTVDEAVIAPWPQAVGSAN